MSPKGPPGSLRYFTVMGQVCMSGGGRGSVGGMSGAGMDVMVPSCRSTRLPAAAAVPPLTQSVGCHQVQLRPVRGYVTRRVVSENLILFSQLDI